MSRMMRDLVQVQGGFKPSVQLPDDFFDEELNRHFVESFIPNEDILNIFKSIRDSLQANAEDRARLFAGTFGTGKSDLMLMVANYLTRPADDSLLAPFFERLRRLDHAKAESIYQARLSQPPFLLVLLQTEGATTFSSFVINGLAQSLDQKGLKHLLGQTYYQAALDVIEQWEQNYPENVNRLNNELEQSYGRTLTQLKNELQGTRGDSSLELFREVVQKVIGMRFEPAAEVRRPADAFMDVAQKLVERREFSGVIVIADEFTHLLHNLAETPGASDAKAIDNLAEKAVRSSQHQLHFYVVSLESFASIRSSSQSSQLALERTGGRFKEYSLRSQNTEELIRAAIGKLITPDKFFTDAQPQLDDLLNLAMGLWGSQASSRNKGRDWLTQTVVQGCFPLHPLTTFCLPRLNQVLAQNQRTMFSFIWDEDQGLKHFIADTSAAPDNGWIPLLTLDRLFDYFESSMNEKRIELLLSYQDSRHKLSAQQFEQGLEGQLLRALMMLDVAGQPADAELMRHAIGLSPARMPDVTAALSELEKTGTAYATQAGYYQLVKRGGVDPYALRRTVEQDAQKIARPLEKLNLDYKPNDIFADRYNSDRGATRQLSARFVSLATLDSPATLSQHLEQNDGVLWYVVSNSDHELDQARAKALQLSRQEPRLVIAVPRTPTDLLMRLQQKLALEHLRETAEYMSAAYQDLLGDAGQIGKDYVGTFRQVRQTFEQPQNFDWHRGGRQVNVTTPAHVSSLASTVMGEVFSATPAHKTAQHLKPTGKSTPLRNALDNSLLQAPFKLAVKTKRGRKSADEAIILDGAGELGLIQQERRDGGFDIYSVCPPTTQQRNSLNIWMLLERELSQDTAWVDIVATLSKPPYGLYPSVLQLFFATFYRYNQDYLEVFSAANVDGAPLMITGSKIIEVVESPNKYVLRYQPLPEEQRKFLRGLVERALYPGRPIQLQVGETASLRTRVAKLLRNWVGDQVPVVARQATVDELTGILEGTPAEVIGAAVALILVAMQPQETGTSKALLDELPLKVGLSSDSSEWSDQKLDQAFAYLESACQALKGFEKAFKKHMAGQIGQYFGLAEPPRNWNDTLTAALEWRTNVVGQVRTSDLGGAPDSRDLLSALDEEPHNFEQVFLIRLPHNWHLGAFEHWREVSIANKFLDRLKEAKEVVEARAIEKGLTQEEQKRIREKLETVFNCQVDNTPAALTMVLHEKINQLLAENKNLTKKVQGISLPINDTLANGNTLINNIMSKVEPTEQLRAFLTSSDQFVPLIRYQNELSAFVQDEERLNICQLWVALTEIIERFLKLDTGLNTKNFQPHLETLRRFNPYQEGEKQWSDYLESYRDLVQAYQDNYVDLHRRRNDVYNQAWEELKTEFGDVEMSEITRHFVSEEKRGNWTQDGLRYVEEAADLVELYQQIQLVDEVKENVRVRLKRDSTNGGSGPEEDTVDKALEKISQIIDQLPQKEQYELWEKLCEIYDPR